jgi:hypothetical protein
MTANDTESTAYSEGKVMASVFWIKEGIVLHIVLYECGTWSLMSRE